MGGSPFFQYLQNHFQHRLRLLKHLVIPEPQYPKSLRLHLQVAARIIFRLFLMLPSIQFDNQLRFQAGEIGDVVADGHLAPEAVAAKLVAAQIAPKVLLGFRRMVS